MTNSRYKPLLAKVKQATETVNNSNTLQNDDELFITMKINTAYQFELILQIESTAVANFKYDLTLPSGATGEHNTVGIQSAVSFADADNSTDINVAGLATKAYIKTTGNIIMGATKGNITLRWSQQTGEVSNTKVYAGSSLRLYS